MTSIDTILFDVDGVLWAAQEAYNECTLFVARKLAQEKSWPLADLSLAHIKAFKRGGGFNSDWDMSWSLIVLLQARAAGRIPAQQDWYALVDENAGRGKAWAQQYAGPDTPDFDAMQRYYDAHYWGASRYPAIYDTEPVINFEPGFAHAEHPAVPPDFFASLRQAGVQQVGIITGRNRNEMRTTRAGLDFDGLLVEESVFTDELGHKPDPTLLERALHVLKTPRALMVGDSLDDLRLVLNYRQLPAARQQAQVSIAMIDHDNNPQHWYDLGADVVFAATDELIPWLQAIE